jgi:AraC-like DNA-binding protein
MLYSKVEPNEKLTGDIDSYFIVKTNNSPVKIDTFFPNGKPAVVFHLGDPFSYWSTENKWTVMPKISFISCATIPVTLRFGANIDTLTVLFRPHSVYNFFGLKLLPSIDAIDGNKYISSDFFQTLQNIPSFEERVKLLNKYFLDRLSECDNEDNLLKKLCNNITSNKGIVERKALAEQFNISEGYIHKLFTKKLGISVKPFSQIVRISNILEEIYREGKSDWFEILDKYGYFDQAHFIKDFKKVTGKTPCQYYSMDKTLTPILSGIEYKNRFPATNNQKPQETPPFKQL